MSGIKLTTNSKRTDELFITAAVVQEESLEERVLSLSQTMQLMQNNLQAMQNNSQIIQNRFNALENIPHRTMGVGIGIVASIFLSQLFLYLANNHK
jgi:hypothetical protein